MKKTALLLTFVSYSTAALYYWPYGGVNELIRYYAYACLFCPNVDTLRGTLTSRFMRFTLVSGTINVAIFLAVGMLVWGVSKLFKHYKTST